MIIMIIVIVTMIIAAVLNNHTTHVAAVTVSEAVLVTVSAENDVDTVCCNSDGSSHKEK